MTYTKPQDITYTQMAIWIDANATSPDCDQTVLYEYLYFLCYMLSKKRSYFTKASAYDSFCLYCANYYIMRLIRGKKHIKSILNYLKKTIHFRRMDFMEEITSDTISQLVESIDVPEYVSNLVDDSNPIDEIEFSVSLETIDRIIHNYLDKIPHKKHSAEWTNIYISCLLTILQYMTPDERQRKIIHRGRQSDVLRMFDEMRHSPTIIYHVSDDYSNYISTLVREVCSVVATELSWKSHTRHNGANILNSVLVNEIGE